MKEMSMKEYFNNTKREKLLHSMANQENEDEGEDEGVNEKAVK